MMTLRIENLLHNTAATGPENKKWVKVRSHDAAAAEAAIFLPQQMGCIGFNVAVHTAADLFNVYFSYLIKMLVI